MSNSDSENSNSPVNTMRILTLNYASAAETVNGSLDSDNDIPTPYSNIELPIAKNPQTANNFDILVLQILDKFGRVGEKA